MGAKSLAWIEDLAGDHTFAHVGDEVHEVGDVLLIGVRLVLIQVFEILIEILLVENVLGLKAIRVREVQVVLGHPLAKVGAGHVLDLLASASRRSK